MNLLRLYGPLLENPSQCQWALLNDKGKYTSGRGSLASLPKRADRIQLIIPASEVVITRARLPASARRGAGSVLAYALEERTASEPDANHVSWLGTIADNDVLAVLDRQGMVRWRDALGKVGIRNYEVHSEMLLLPRVENEWSVAWNGQEGFARISKLEAAATDSGDQATPPLALRLLIDQAEKNGNRPLALALYPTTDDALPDIEAWQAALGVPVRVVGSWDWRAAPAGEGTSLTQETLRWRGLADMLPKLRLAAWIMGIALAIHAIALTVDWTLLAGEQRSLRQQMTSRFRVAFPDAVAVVDPLLQMRRKLAEARHAAGQPDVGDFLPMIEKVVAEMKDVPVGSIRILSYESGRMTIDVMAVDESSVIRIVGRLRQAGLTADSSSNAGRTVITVRVS